LAIYAGERFTNGTTEEPVRREKDAFIRRKLHPKQLKMLRGDGVEIRPPGELLVQFGERPDIR
jgi:hypothetical protein